MQVDKAVCNVIPSIKKLRKKDRVLKNPEVQCPDLFICGAAKSGTTSLFKYLGQHPSIFTPTLKEPGYFSALRPVQDPYQYAALFDEANDEQILCDASTAYLTSPDSPVRISNANPQAKIIIILRNPIDRAFSLYHWMIREGYEWLNSFEEALQQEEQRASSVNFIRNNPEYYYNYLYKRSGLYSHQLRRYTKNFETEDILFISFDKFITSPENQTKKVFNFLGIEKSININVTVENKGKRAKSVLLQYILKKVARVLDSKLEKGHSFVEKIMDVNKGNKKMELKSSTKNKLKKYFKKDVKEAEKIAKVELAKD